MTLVRSAKMDDNTHIPKMVNGTFGKFLTINLRCGCMNTKNTQKIAKYNIYGVKIDSSMVAPNRIE